MCYKHDDHVQKVEQMLFFPRGRKVTSSGEVVCGVLGADPPCHHRIALRCLAERRFHSKTKGRASRFKRTIAMTFFTFHRAYEDSKRHFNKNSVISVVLLKWHVLSSSHSLAGKKRSTVASRRVVRLRRWFFEQRAS